MLDKKLQLKDGQTIAVLHNPGLVDISASPASADVADAVLVIWSADPTWKSGSGP